MEAPGAAPPSARARPRRARRALQGCAWAAALLAVAALLARVFLLDLYQVESGSMEPTLFGSEDAGEWVLVGRGGTRELERFDLVVMARHGGSPVVKRVVGLPGERVQIVRGDLRIGGELLPPDAPRPPWVALFDERRRDVADAFQPKRVPEGPWSKDGEDWVLDARGIESSELGRMHYRFDLTDGYLDPSGELVTSPRQVNDGVLECRVRVDEPGGLLRFSLVERGDTFELALEPSGDRTARAELRRTNAETLRRLPESGGHDLLAETELPFPLGAWHGVRFGNVDDALFVDLEGRGRVLTHPYEGNAPYEGVLPLGGSRQTLGPPAALGGERLVARFRDVRLLRDLYWHARGEHAVAEPIVLGPDEYFFLGDNSADSTDGRFFGAVRARDVVGSPLAVVWPPDRARAVRGAVAPGEAAFGARER